MTISLLLCVAGIVLGYYLAEYTRPHLPAFRSMKLVHGFLGGLLLYTFILWFCLAFGQPGPGQVEWDWPIVRFKLYVFAGLPPALLVAFMYDAMSSNQY